MYLKLTDDEEWLTGKIVTISIHLQQGSGVLKSIYAKCFYQEVFNRNILFEKDKVVPFLYKGIKSDNGIKKFMM